MYTHAILAYNIVWFFLLYFKLVAKKNDKSGRFVVRTFISSRTYKYVQYLSSYCRLLIILSVVIKRMTKFILFNNKELTVSG